MSYIFGILALLLILVFLAIGIPFFCKAKRLAIGKGRLKTIIGAVLLLLLFIIIVFAVAIAINFGFWYLFKRH